MYTKTDMSGLNKLQKNLSELGKLNTIAIGDVMTNEFISRYSSYSSLDELVDASGFDVNTAEDFKAIPDDEWEAFIVGNTSFSSWKEMQHKSHEEFVHKKLTKDS
ncbi:hypothetical protein VOI46_09520 [Pseudoalteromonas sp. CuT4-3]|uniref:hypothetical protein n=1 Tax=Pseudoalteromonas sp. CuT4-3 TaxID=3112573 RepID=UPI002D78DD31|nr:hypothetical protein [Pseudoalteromonas sp. CuT 4-3]WRU71771.1 hypothetical protein VOI46_09520 [Pseudoalteromonas sp. CuT 4-3]